MSNLPQTRQSLLVRLRSQSNDAWAEFLEIYEGAIIKYACSRGLQEADARDVTQEVLAAVTKKVESWEVNADRGKFRGWLFRVAQNVAVDRIHKQSRQVAASGDTQVVRLLSETPHREESESNAFWAEYRRKLFHWAAARIRPEVKETSWNSFWLTSVEGEKPEDVAVKLGISTGSVYAAKFRIMSRLREIVSRLDDSDDAEERIISDMRKQK